MGDFNKKESESLDFTGLKIPRDYLSAYGGKNMMYRTELVEGITVENVTEKINAKIEEMEKESYRLVTMSFWGTERAVLVFKKGLKGSLL